MHPSILLHQVERRGLGWRNKTARLSLYQQMNEMEIQPAALHFPEKIILSSVKRINKLRWAWTTQSGWASEAVGQWECSQDLVYMRHFTASKAIRQDGPLALSPLTGVVSVFCVHSCFRIKKNLHIGSIWVSCTTNETYLCQSRNDVGEKQVGTLFIRFV